MVFSPTAGKERTLFVCGLFELASMHHYFFASVILSKCCWLVCFWLFWDGVRICVTQVCFTLKSVSLYSAGRRHNLDSDLRDKLGRQFSPERRLSVDRSGRRVQRFNGKICSFGFSKFCWLLVWTKICQLVALDFFLLIVTVGIQNCRTWKSQALWKAQVCLLLRSALLR